MVGLDLPLEKAIELCPHFIGGPHDPLMQEIYEMGDKSLSFEEISQLDTQFYCEIRGTMPIKPRQGFLDVLGELRGIGIETSIGSLTDTDNAVLIFERSGLTNEFQDEKIVLKEHVANLKPAPDVFLETARRMGISPDEQLVFEDSHNGILAA